MADSLSQFQALLVLNALPEVGPITTHRLLAEFDEDPCGILGAGVERLMQVRGVGEVISRSIVSWREVFDLEVSAELAGEAAEDEHGLADGAGPGSVSA